MKSSGMFWILERMALIDEFLGGGTGRQFSSQFLKGPYHKRSKSSQVPKCRQAQEYIKAGSASAALALIKNAESRYRLVSKLKCRISAVYYQWRLKSWRWSVLIRAELIYVNTGKLDKLDYQSYVGTRRISLKTRYDFLMTWFSFNEHDGSSTT